MTAEKILLVDDEEGIRKVLGISLADIGYDVRTAENGENALRIFKEFQPPVVLTDIKMPGMDGIELLRKIKTENPEAEVIMITGHGDMNLAIKSLKYEATDFITKPINQDVLEIALKRAHEKISMRRQIKDYTENLEQLVREKSAKIVELERQTAVGQTVEGLTSAIRNIAGDLEDGITYSHEMPCFVSIHDRDLKVVATNQLYTQRLGNFVGDGCWKIYCGETARPDTCPTAETIRSGTGLRRKETIRYLNGTEAPVIVHTAPIKNRDGKLDLVVEISVDITEVRRLQEELRTTQQRYQELFDEVPCYISVQDKALKITAANRRFKEDFGHDIGRFCFEIYQHQDQACLNCPVQKTFEDGNSHQAEMMVTSQTGEKYNVLVWTAPIRNARGEITQVMEMSTNITQIRQLQDHLSSLGLLIGSISHGIKGLLTGLDGGMYLLNTGFAKANQVQVAEGWEIVKLMIGRIRSMVLDILYYAKERELKWELIDVLSFVKDIAFTFGPKIQSQRIDFACDFDETVGRFEVDPGIVRSALINLLENALEACLADPSKPIHRIAFGVRQDSTHIIFDVIDNGIGMDEATRKNIFTLFFSSKGDRGTGLGLFISNKIIRQHGGTIEVDSKPGEGTRMGIKIPKMIPDSLKKPADQAAV
ncbi:MAG: response regulator [Thermodesulfobacteriota bacterium]